MPYPLVVNTGAVVAGILDAASADDVLRSAFPEARRRGAPLLVVITAAVPVPVEPWAGKYPDVPLTVVDRHRLDPAIGLAAAARGGALLVTAEPAAPRDAAVLRAVTRRVRCPVVRVTGTNGSGRRDDDAFR